jgi:hypothetical protein
MARPEPELRARKLSAANRGAEPGSDGEAEERSGAEEKRKKKGGLCMRRHAVTSAERQKA